MLTIIQIKISQYAIYQGDQMQVPIEQLGDQQKQTKGWNLLQEKGKKN